MLGVWPPSLRESLPDAPALLEDRPRSVGAVSGKMLADPGPVVA